MEGSGNECGTYGKRELSLVRARVCERDGRGRESGPDGVGGEKASEKRETPKKRHTPWANAHVSSEVKILGKGESESDQRETSSKRNTP